MKSNPDWLTAIKNSPVAKLNEHLLESATQVSDTEKSNAARKSSKGKSKYLDKMHWDLFGWCAENNLLLVRELRFHKFRKYRFDFAILKNVTEKQAKALEFSQENMVAAVEYEGGILTDTSGHKTAKNYNKDTEKYNLAQSLGWKVLRFTVLNYKNCLQELEKHNE